MGGSYTEMVGPITPLLLCWVSLIVTVVGLGLGFFFTNITAFAKRTRQGRKPTVGSDQR